MSLPHGIERWKFRRAFFFAALNGRPVQRLIDPRVDLAAPSPPGWIVPLERDPTPSVVDGSR